MCVNRVDSNLNSRSLSPLWQRFFGRICLAHRLHETFDETKRPSAIAACRAFGGRGNQCSDFFFLLIGQAVFRSKAHCPLRKKSLAGWRIDHLQASVMARVVLDSRINLADSLGFAFEQLDEIAARIEQQSGDLVTQIGLARLAQDRHQVVIRHQVRCGAEVDDSSHKELMMARACGRVG